MADVTRSTQLRFVGDRQRVARYWQSAHRQAAELTSSPAGQERPVTMIVDECGRSVTNGPGEPPPLTACPIYSGHYPSAQIRVVLGRQEWFASSSERLLRWCLLACFWRPSPFGRRCLVLCDTARRSARIKSGAHERELKPTGAWLIQSDWIGRHPHPPTAPAA